METKYSATANQSVQIQINKGNKKFTVEHVLSALSDSRYLEFDKESEKQAKKTLLAEKVSVSLDTFLTDAKQKLWNELIIERKGYKETADWKAKTHVLQQVSAISALLFVQAFWTVSDENSDEILESELLSDDETFDISLRVIFDGQELILRHVLRTETKDELDEYLAILSGQPQKNALASAVKSKAERYALLYDALCETNSGYENDIVPIWHKIEVVVFFFENQLSQLGKF